MATGKPNLNRQRQTEGTPRDFDPKEARETSRNMVDGREHLSEIDREDDDDEDTLTDDDFGDEDEFSKDDDEDESE